MLQSRISILIGPSWDHSYKTGKHALNPAYVGKAVSPTIKLEEASMTNPKDEVLQLIRTYFAEQSKFDGDKLLAAWHPDGMMYLVGNNNEFRIVSIEEQAAHINEVQDRVPDLQVKFEIDEIEHIAVHDDLIASVHVNWRMIFPEGYGEHRTFFNLAKIHGQWGIVNSVDRGFQVLEA